ncbi:hypothetical protein DFP79_2523 [Marinomonas balearica]|uniref:Uncharacterized protein n=1 Tax=Marinomonas balearica TaxID=491947 RepID=A0A4R6M7A7_9GAMM|nr:hypothetical protein DFP79_2523 [Marinomonas balearica]
MSMNAEMEKALMSKEGKKRSGLVRQRAGEWQRKIN